jgi:hypothetical protein
MNENTTSTRRVNVTLGGGKAVHLGSAMTVNGREYAASPDCGGNRATERYRETSMNVTCRRCLKLLADEQAKEEAYQDRLAASLMPATEAHDLGHYDPTAPAHVSTAVLPANVTMDPVTRVLSGQFKAMKALYEDGLAFLSEDGDLILK